MRQAVTIIMPAHKVTAYIRTALDSVFAQTFRDFEVIVVNDGCPDTRNLEQELDAFASRIIYIKQENEGVGSARRTAVDAASAPLIAQLDPDDWWEPDYLEIQLRLMEASSGADLIYPNGYYFGIPALEGKLLMDYTRSEGEVTFSNAMRTKVNIIYSGLIRRESILRAGNFDPKFRTSEDFDLWMRMLKSGARIVYHREPLLHYRLRQDSLTWGRVEAQTWFLQVLDKLETILDLSAEERESLQARRTAVQMEMELARGKEAIQRRSWKDASWHLELYRNYRPSRKLNLVLMMLRRCPWLLGTGLTARDRLLQSGWLRAKRPQQA
ncbi:MAG: glycosyltransferase family A protein [Bryobacteraceae bacterium]